MKLVRRAVPTTVPQPCADSALNQISLEYNYAELQQATRNFDASMKLGSGSYGGVYKGVLKDGTEVAIKVLDVPDEAGFEEEVKVLSKFRHPNLVILMGFARHGTQRSLVYEMLAGGDVHKRLHRSCVESFPFPWKERVSIALDAACGLSHLHHSSPKVFHRDIKTPNILLDKNGTAKMADFGLACLSHASAHRVKQASGTVGYACPLYVQRGVVTEGSEVYSFGMVLIELLTASPPAYMGNNATNANQIQYLANHINGDINVVLSLVDTKAQWTPPAARAIGDFALKCIKMREEERPGFAEIVRTIRAIYDGSALQAPNAAASSSAADRREVSPNPHLHRRPSVGPSGVAVAQAPAMLHGHCPGRPVAPQAFAHGKSFPLAPQAGVAAGPQPAAGRHVSPPRTPPMTVTPQARPPYYSGPAAGHGAHRGDVEKAALPQQQSPLKSRQRANSPPQAAAFAASSQPMLKGQASPSAVKGPPILFTLECIFSEGISLHDVPREQRLIVHRLDSEDDAVTCAPLPPLRVGRIFQTALFDVLVPDDGPRSTISREHFQVWAEEVPDQSDPGRGHVACSFSLTNFSGNGTHINDDHLKARGERSILHDGDIITLTRSVTGPDGTYQARFITFRFDLSESCICEAEWFDDEDSTRSVGSGPDVTLSQDCLPNRTGDLDRSSFCEGDLAFVLEVCGPAVHEEVPLEQRRIAYSPPLEDDSLQPHLYSSLIVGRAHQLNFWQEVLHNEAFNTLSRQHFEVQTWRNVSREVPFSFLVRNLSDVNPIHVRGGPEETTEDPPVMLAKGEQRHLLDGDEILLNIDQEHTFWIIFCDLTKSTQLECSNPDITNFGSFLPPSRHALEPRHMMERNAAERLLDYRANALDYTTKQASPLKLGRQGLPASVLRPPLSLHLKEEDDGGDSAYVSTAATPHDLHHQDEEEEEDDDGMATHVGMGYPKAGVRGLASSGTPSASSSSSRRTAAVISAAGGGHSPSAQPQGGGQRDARGLRDDAHRSSGRRPMASAGIGHTGQVAREAGMARERHTPASVKGHRQLAVQPRTGVRDPGYPGDARLPFRPRVR